MSTTSPSRRHFLAAAGATTALASLSLRAHAQPTDPKPARPPGPGDAHRANGNPVLISSGNGLSATARAMELLQKGTYILDAIVAGVKVVEDDPNDNSVGYGGLPNEDGIVELDASCMDGRLHRAGSVASLRNIKNPASVALQVMRRTDHVMLVGEGGLRFARSIGFPEENLLTEASHKAWLRWKAELGKGDNWLNDDQRDPLPDGASDAIPGAPDSGAAGDRNKRQSRADVAEPIPFTTGTIHCSGLSAARDGGGGDLAAVTTTSGLSWKLPGRIGDSPICGAGMYCDNAVGSAGSTGRGEAVIQVCGAFSVVQHMESGLSPTEACLAVLKRMADRTREKRLKDPKGRPSFNVSMYALRKDGAYGAACLHPGGTFIVHDGKENRKLNCVALFED